MLQLNGQSIKSGLAQREDGRRLKNEFSTNNGPGPDSHLLRCDDTYLELLIIICFCPLERDDSINIRMYTRKKVSVPSSSDHATVLSR